MYFVLLIDKINNNSYVKYSSNDYFDCEVYIDHHKYSCPKNCYYKITAKEI